MEYFRDNLERVVGHTYQLKSGESWAGYRDLKYHLFSNRFNPENYHLQDVLNELNYKQNPARYRFPMARIRLFRRQTARAKI